MPALRCIGNITSSNESDFIYTLVDKYKLLSILDTLIDYLVNNQEMKYAKEVFWVISNIAAGPPDAISAIVSHEGIMKKLIVYSAYHNIGICIRI